MTAAYPLPRNIRQSDVLAGNGGKTYGPFSFSVWDTSDVVVEAKAFGAPDFLPVDVLVQKVNGEPFDTFTVTFPAPVPASTSFVVTSRRLHQRTTDILRGNAIRSAGLEAELSQQATVLQELQRDLVDLFGRALSASLAAAAQIGAEAAAALASAALARAIQEAGNIVTQGNVPIYPSVVSASALTIPAALTTAFLHGRSAPGDHGGGTYRRVTGEPAHAAKFRSTDRYLPNGAVDVASGGWWELIDDEIVPQQLGAIGDGVADDTASLLAAIGRRRPVKFVPNSILRTGNLQISANADVVEIDLRGATLRPVNGLIGGVPWYTIFSDAGGTVIPVTEQVYNTNYIGLQTVADVAPGMWIMLSATDNLGKWPPSWRKIKSVIGNRVYFDQNILVQYSGTISARVMTTFRRRVALYNGVLDLSVIDPMALGPITLQGWEEVVIEDLAMVGVNLDKSNTDYLFQAGTCLSVHMHRLRLEDAQRNGMFCRATACADAKIEDVRASGDGFGLGIDNSDYAWIGDCRIIGKHPLGGGTTSVRGMKVIGCFSHRICGNVITAYDSGIKIEDTFGGVVAGNDLTHCLTGINHSDQAPIQGLRTGFVYSNNRVRFSLNNTNALGIGDVQTENVTICNNIIENSSGNALAARGKNLTITGNVISNWGIADRANSSPIIVTAVGSTGLVAGNHCYAGPVLASQTKGINLGNSGVKLGANNVRDGNNAEIASLGNAMG